MHLLLLEMKQMITYFTPTDQLERSAEHQYMALTDLQFSQILTFLSNSPIEDPDKAFNTALFLRNRNRRNAKAKCEPFWLSPKFQAWAQSQKSSLIMVKGNFGSRQDVKDFLTNAISCIREANIPVIWALKVMDSTSSGVSVVELLKYLTHQALQQGLPPTERSLALSCTRFQTARKANKWFDILAVSLVDLKQIYIAVDVELLDPVLSNESDGLSLPDAFSKLFEELRTRSPGIVVKVVLVSYRSQVWSQITEENRGNVISVGKPKPKASRVIDRRRGSLSVRGHIGRNLIISKS
ncbi:hypothetical protein F4809DRAFT_88280 [Biscogniauxia mediterranea]|nr:hypothetical protein F4809DRAFT_88280 [Biscogniauxia mediterranea]